MSLVDYSSESETEEIAPPPKIAKKKRKNPPKLVPKASKKSKNPEKERKSKKVVLPSAADALADSGQDSVDFLRVDAKRSDRTLAFLEKNREEKINQYQEGKKELIKAKAMSEKHRLQLLEKEREFNETEAYGKEISDKIKTMINDGTVNPKVAYRGIGRGGHTKNQTFNW